MYKCEVCTNVSEPGEMLLRHAIMRDRKCTRPEKMADGRMTIVAATRPEIAAEIKVCKGCKHALEAGVPLHQLRKNYQRHTIVHQVVADKQVSTDKPVPEQLYLLKPVITPESRVASVASMGKSARRHNGS